MLGAVARTGIVTAGAAVGSAAVGAGMLGSAAVGDGMLGTVGSDTPPVEHAAVRATTAANESGVLSAVNIGNLLNT